MLEVYGKTDRGNVRANNEDRICYPRADTTSPPPTPEAGQLFIVADGVGGSQAGEHASNQTVETLKKFYYYGDHTQDPRWLLQQAIRKANDEVLNLTQTNPAFHGAASTVTAAVVKDNQLYVANVGDSRTYLIQANGHYKRITKDHSLTQQKIDRGLISPEQAKMDADSHIITRSIGLDAKIEVDRFPQQNDPSIILQPGDAILLCSDGLTDLVYDDEIARIVTRNHPKQAVQQLINLAKRKGGHDNISAIVGRMPGGPRPARLAWLPTSATVLTNRWLWLVLVLALVGGALWWFWPVIRPQGALFKMAATPASLVTRVPSPTAAATALLAAPSTPASATQVTEPTATRIAVATHEAAAPTQLAPVPTPAVPPVSAPPQTPSATVTPDVSRLPSNRPDLIAPEPDHNVIGNEKTIFIWKWQDRLQGNYGFEILIWPKGNENAKEGVHNAKVTTNLQPDANGIYRMELNIANNRGDGDYEWTVAVVQLEPYLRIIEATPRHISISAANDHHEKKSEDPGAAGQRSNP